MKVTVDAKTKKILEGAILGINGDEVLQSFLAVMLAAIPYTAQFRGRYISIQPLPSTCQPARTLRPIGVSVPLCSTQTRR
jgi:pyruvate/2-oxoglutarate dehydrogenase complex dihydrolipoamide dehydrogenase (E3) component